MTKGWGDHPAVIWTLLLRVSRQQPPPSLGDRTRRPVHPAGDFLVRQSRQPAGRTSPARSRPARRRTVDLLAGDGGVQRAGPAVGHVAPSRPLPLIQVIPGVPELRADAGRSRPARACRTPTLAQTRRRAGAAWPVGDAPGPPGDHQCDGLKVGATEAGLGVADDDGGDGVKVLSGHGCASRLRGRSARCWPQPNCTFRYPQTGTWTRWRARA